MSEFTFDLPNLSALQNQWRRGLRFGVLMAPLHPTPAIGDKVSVRVRCVWEGRAFEVAGQVVQASEANTVLELESLSDATRTTLVELGLSEAETVESKAAAPPAEPASAEPASAEPAPAEPAPAVEPAPAEPPPPVAAAPAVAPTPTEEVPAKPAAPRAAAAAFRPPPAKPRAAAWSPPAAAPRPRSAPVATAAPPATEVPVDSGTPASEEPGLRQIAESAGPASLSSETVLPPATAHGDFGSMSWRDVLLHFFDQKATGVVAVEAFREIRWCYLIDGQPVHYLGDKPHPGEFLSDALVADGVLELPVWTEALRMQRVTGIPAGEYLVRTGVLSRDALQGALSRRAARITRNLMGMNFGKFRFHPFPRLSEVFDHEPVDVLAVLLGSQREALAAIEDERLTQQVQNLYPLHAKPVEARRGLLAQLPLTEEERRVALELLPACWTLGELVALKEMDERRLVRLLLALKALGMVQFTREEGSESKRNRAERILYVGLRDLIRRNDFEALHAHWSSSSTEIEQGYRKILEEYGRERFQQVLDERLEELMTEIRQRADSIWERLKDSKGRRAARKEVVGDDQLRMASDLLDRQGEMAAFKNDFLLVRACSQRVLELDPGGSEGVENIRRAKTWLADPRVQGLSTSGTEAARLEEIQRKLDSLL